MPQRYQPLRYRLGQREGYLLWSERAFHRSAFDAEGRLISFGSLPGLRRHAQGASVELQVTPIFLDLQSLASWLEEPAAETMRAGSFYRCWQLFRILAAGARLLTRDREQRALVQDTYNLLFWKGQQAEQVSTVYDKLWRETQGQGTVPLQHEGDGQRADAVPLHQLTQAGAGPRGRRPQPALDPWSTQEIECLSQVLGSGLELFRERSVTSGTEPPRSSQTYLPLRLRLDGDSAFLLWSEKAFHKGAFDEEGRLRMFGNLGDLRELAEELGVHLQSARRTLDLDVVEQWLQDPGRAGIKARPFLEAWNLFRILATAARVLTRDRKEKEFLGRVHSQLFWKDEDGKVTAAAYDKLWRRGKTLRLTREDLDAMAWTDEDVDALRLVLGSGLALLRSRLPPDAGGDEPKEARFQALRCRLEGMDRFILWCERGLDQRVFDREGRLLVFDDLGTLQRQIERAGLRLEPGLPALDLDRLQRWLDRPTLERLDSRGFLQAWGCFRTLAVAVNTLALDTTDEQASRQVYDHLAWKDEQASLTQAAYNQLFRHGRARLASTRGDADSLWTEELLGHLHQLLQLGFTFFRTRLGTPS